MQAKCDKCGQCYEVNESRLSALGARIKCPSCGNIFIVRPRNASPNAGLNRETPIKPGDINDLPIPSAEELLAAAGTPENSQNAPKTEAKSEGNAWRVHHMGLTYNFHDLSSLQDWLRGRVSLNGVKIAKGEDDWKLLGDYKEVMTTDLITKYFPLGDVPTTADAGAQAAQPAKEAFAEPIRAVSQDSMDFLQKTGHVMSTVDLTAPISSNNKKQVIRARARVEAEKKDAKKKMISVAIVLVLLAVAGVGVLRYMQTGRIPFIDDAPVQAVETPAPAPVQETKPAAETPKTETAPAKPETDKPQLPTAEELEEIARKEVQKQIEEAKSMVAKKQWPEARATLESLLAQRPDNADALQLMVQTYRGLGMNDKAADAELQLKRVRANQKKVADPMDFSDKEE